jgi:heme-degrading monooxygenase HmoA
MFARKVAARLKPNSLTKFVEVIEREVLPWLRTQEGFLDLIILATPDSSEVATISFWDHHDNVQAYRSSGYPQVLKVLNDLLESAPYVKTFEVVGSTLQGLAQGMRESENPRGEGPPESRSFGTHA